MLQESERRIAHARQQEEARVGAGRTQRTAGRARQTVREGSRRYAFAAFPFIPSPTDCRGHFLLLSFAFELSDILWEFGYMMGVPVERKRQREGGNVCVMCRNECTCLQTYVCAPMYACACMHVHFFSVCMHVCMYVCIYVCMHVHMMYVCMYVCTFV